MKKFLLKIVLFLAIALPLYLVLVCVWGEFLSGNLKPNWSYQRAAMGHTFSRLKEVQKTGKVDVLFLGSSHTYRGFDNRIFTNAGISSFNLGTSSQTPLQTKVLLNRYLDQLNPDLIIYETYPKIFTLDGVESALDIIANDDNDLHSIKMALELRHLKVYNTLIYSFYMQLSGRKNNYHIDDDYKTEHYQTGGYVMKDLKHYAYQEYEKKSHDIVQMDLKGFSEVVEFLRSKDYPIVFVQAPITPALYTSFDNNEEFDSLMSSYGAYHNFNEISVLDDSLHFYDKDHLNQKGVDIFNQDLIDVLDL